MHEPVRYEPAAQLDASVQGEHTRSCEPLHGVVSYVPAAHGVHAWQYRLDVPPHVPARNDPAAHDARHDTHVGGANDTRMRMLHAATP